MNKPLQFIIYLNDKQTGTMVFKASKQHHKIDGVKNILWYAAELEQLCRAMEISSSQGYSIEVLDVASKLHKVECGYELRMVTLRVWKIEELVFTE